MKGDHNGDGKADNCDSADNGNNNNDRTQLKIIMKKMALHT
jgi:hypothetical protein